MSNTLETDSYLLWDGKPTTVVESCQRLERQRNMLRDELIRIRDVVGEIDAELIDEVLERATND